MELVFCSAQKDNIMINILINVNNVIRDVKLVQDQIGLIVNNVIKIIILIILPVMIPAHQDIGVILFLKYVNYVIMNVKLALED